MGPAPLTDRFRLQPWRYDMMSPESNDQSKISNLQLEKYHKNLLKISQIDCSVLVAGVHFARQL